ncbi:glycosyltransferase [Kitasatospora sp. GP82]|uniref:glycosyltransferase n=1 Tax=Kitasatospora sp. GP82 TaxID=3035089 RepID=UPI0024752FF0|nr:glycosyltransferase [Kitasatospora sp. GP82]MDH6130534.1 hypothetical protein [Kitasatospora sp. GP82]
MPELSVDTALIFYAARGRSAPMARDLLHELNARGHTTRIHAGSLGHSGDPSHAPTFYAGLDVLPYDYNPAFAAWQLGEDPQDLEELPFHPSFEDRSMGQADCPDPMFAAIPVRGAMRLANAWHRHLLDHRPTAPVDVLHLHHLSYLQTAAYKAYGDVPTVTTLHGTELTYLDAIVRRINLAHRLDSDVNSIAANFPFDRIHRSVTIDRITRRHQLSDEERLLLETTDWAKWRHTEIWYHRLLHAADLAGQIVTVSEQDRDLACRLLPSIAGKDVPVISNGVNAADRYADLYAEVISRTPTPAAR